MNAEEISPKIIQRRCGGWLSVSGEGDLLQIGITAPTETEAWERFRSTAEVWRARLAAERAPGVLAR